MNANNCGDLHNIPIGAGELLKISRFNGSKRYITWHIRDNNLYFSFSNTVSDTNENPKLNYTVVDLPLDCKSWLDNKTNKMRLLMIPNQKISQLSYSYYYSFDVLIFHLVSDVKQSKTYRSDKGDIIFDTITVKKSKQEKIVSLTII